jgi:DNA-directed RNA polymerase subunit N
MLPPVRCFTCGAPLGHLWEEFKGRTSSGESAEAVLDDLGVYRYCCRRTLLTTLTYIEEIAKYSIYKKHRESVILKYYHQIEREEGV